MIINCQTQKIFIINIILVSFLFLAPSFIYARRFSPFSMPVGATTTINGQAVIKVTKNGKFVDLAKWML